MKSRKSKTMVQKRTYLKSKVAVNKSSSDKLIKRKNSARKRLRRQSYPVHKRLLLHPLTIFGLLCVGVFIAGWTFRAVADTVISSVIEAPLLQAGATITSPSNGASFSTSLINVTGDCPDNSYIKLYLNNVFDGVAWCNPDQTFTIETSLFLGSNVLSTQDYNETDLPGPATSSVTVEYNIAEVNPSLTNTKPISNSEATNSTKTSSQSSLPLLIGSNFQFKTFTASKEFTWQLDIQGGTPPYTLHVAWGDGTSSNLYFKTDPIFTLKHTYKTSGYFAVVVAATDSKGQKRTFQMAALITNSAGLLPGVASSSEPLQQSLLTKLDANIKKQQWLLVAWPAYLTILLMTISFWLGERREYASPKTR